MSYIETKYIHLLSSQLEKFERRKPNLWNFRCCFCGDSQRNKNKARAFIFVYKNDYFFKCHNCSTSMKFSSFLEKMNPTLYKEYRLELFREKNPNAVDKRKVISKLAGRPKFVTKSNPLKDLTPLEKLNSSHPAKEYILNRRLPLEALYYAEKFKEWTNSIEPNHFKDTSKDEPRIIIPFLSREGKLFGYQGRSLSKFTTRYLTVMLDKSFPKIFGLNRINYDKTIYVTEGPFDALLLDNAIAMSGSSLGNYNDLRSRRLVFIYDNEPRNRDIAARMSIVIDSGGEIVIWPSYIKEKDINDMHLAGYDVNQLVRENIHSNLTAKLLLDQWRK